MPRPLTNIGKLVDASRREAEVAQGLISTHDVAGEIGEPLEAHLEEQPSPAEVGAGFGEPPEAQRRHLVAVAIQRRDGLVEHRPIPVGRLLDGRGGVDLVALGPR